MIENWKLQKIYKTRAMFICPFHKSQKGGADLDLTIEGDYSGKFFCYSCKKSGSVPMADVIKLREMRGETKEQTKVLDWSKLHQEYVRKRYQSGVFPPLKISPETLTKVGWGFDGVAHTFPERNEKNQIIGMLRRFPDGNKGVVAGSCRGLTVPTIQFDSKKVLYITEGVSDLCVVLEAGLQGIARPNASSCNEMLVQWLCLHYAESGKIVIVADNDTTGIDGAKLLYNEIRNIKLESGELARFDVQVQTPPEADLYDTFLELDLEETRKWLQT